MQLTPFAFPSHPFLFSLTPNPPPVKKKKSFAYHGRFMALVQTANPFDRNREKFVVSFLTL